MKKFMILAIMAFMLAGCGNNIDDVESTSTTENLSAEENYDEYSDEYSDEENETIEEISSVDTTIADLNNDKNTESPQVQPDEIDKPSPVDNVSNSIFVDVSSAVRNTCNSTANADSVKIGANWKAMINTNEEKIYTDTALKLINSYSRLNNCRKLIYDNNDVVTDDDIALLTEIEDGLGTNVEIFLNTNTTSIMSDSGFDYSDELDELELSLQNKAS